MSNTVLSLSPAFKIYNSIVKTATTTTATYALPIDSTNTSRWQNLIITNLSDTNDCFFKLGTSSVTATLESTALPKRSTIEVSRNNLSHIALITGTLTASISVTVGSYEP